MVDHSGDIVDGDEILYIITRHRQATINGGVVGTLMSNLGLEKAIQAMGLDFHRSRVGDRYVLEMLQDKGLRLGGESSGHIINLNLTSTGDGIISALQVLEAVVTSGKSLRDLKNTLHKFPQKLVNIRVKSSIELGDYPEISAAVKGVENEMGKRGRVLLRTSGTEPLVRVMVEGEDTAQVDAMMKLLVGNVEHALQDKIV